MYEQNSGIWTPAGTTKSVEDVVAGSSAGAQMFTSQFARTGFDKQKGIEAYRSWVFVCAFKNAQAIAATPLRLYLPVQAGQGDPKNAPFRRLKAHEERKVKAQARLSLLTAEGVVNGGF